MARRERESITEWSFWDVCNHCENVVFGREREREKETKSEAVPAGRFSFTVVQKKKSCTKNISQQETKTILRHLLENLRCFKVAAGAAFL